MIIFALLEWLAQNKDRIWPPAQFRESSSRGSLLPLRTRRRVHAYNSSTTAPLLMLLFFLSRLCQYSQV